MSRMTHRARGGILVRALPLAVLVLCASPAPPARADAWGDARKAFRAAQRAEEMETRRNAFVTLLEFDGTDAVEEIFRALAREENPAVVLTAIQTLSTFQSEEAVKALEQAVRAEKGDRRVQALIALADRPGEEGKTALLDALVDKEEPVVAQAAWALGRKQVKEAVPGLVALLSSPTWQVRAAAARGLRLMAGGPVIDPQTAKEVLHPPPAWLDVKALLPPLARSLATAEGRDRSDLVETLERLTAQKYGYDPAAWTRLAEGADPQTITAAPPAVPFVYGIPLLGRKVVFVIDISTCTDDTHPFQDLARLKEVCQVPGARPVAWYELRTTKQFFSGHARRCIADLLPGTKFEVLADFQKVEPLFGRLTTANAGTKQTAATFIEAFTIQGGPNHYAALTQALDISGTKEAIAWSLGPDEIVFMTCSVPWAPKEPNAVVNQDEVGAAVGLKARIRMVPIHTVGVGPHPFGMMRVISEQSGGRYLDLSR